MNAAKHTRTTLKATIEYHAKDAGVSPIEMISTMQSLAANRGDEKTIAALADLKWDYITL